MSVVYEVRDLAVDVPLGRGLMDGMMGAPLRLNILDGITLSVGRGETLGLVGESGSGKTTLARAMMGLVPAASGSLTFEGRDLATSADFSALRRRSALMFQDATASLSPRMKVGALLAEPFAIHGIRLPDRRRKARELLERIGLPGAFCERYPHELSGGQARRVCVARALALDPALVVADEPTAGLDVSVQGEILNLLATLKSDLGIAFLVISHNLAMVRHVTDRIAILYLGRLVETGPTRDVFARPAHPYTASLIASEPQPDPRKRRETLAIEGEVPSVMSRPSGCEFHTRCPRAEALCRRDRPALREVAPGRAARCHFAEDQLALEETKHGLES